MATERRKVPRITATDLPFRFVNERGEPETFELMDLSESGARIQCQRRLAAMTKVQVGVVLPGHLMGGADDVHMTTTGVVVWCHEVAEGRYDTGVFFSELAEEHREILRSFVQASA